MIISHLMLQPPFFPGFFLLFFHLNISFVALFSLYFGVDIQKPPYIPSSYPS